MLGESLQDGADYHEHGTSEDRRTSTIPLAQPRRNGNSEDGTELVACAHETNNLGVDAWLAILRCDVSVSEI
jgi:hypothetical protein